jgi:glycosyltransferase involved in cell wall biosynthesis
MSSETTATTQALSDRLAYKKIGFAGNSWSGRGGQGEILRSMVFTLDHLPGATVYSRSATTRRARAVDIPLSGFPWAQLSWLSGLPGIRRRRDWQTLLSDLQFDRHVRSKVGEPDLFDGVMAQCCDTLLHLRGRRTRLVMTCLNTHIDNLAEVVGTEHQKLGYGGYHPFHPLMRKRALREIEVADFIRVTSEWAKQTFVERGVPAAKIHAIHPGIDLKHFHPAQKRDDVFRVLAVATIDPRKGIHYLLQAFEEAAIPRSELVIIGGTTDRWSSRMLSEFLSRNSNIRQRVVDVATTPVAETYGSASVLVHPAIEDGYALVVPEALACGSPVIVTRQSGASELIQEGKNGFVVESRSIDQLRDRLQLLASDRSLREAMSSQAPASVAHIGYDDYARRVLAFYDEVLGGRQV